MSNYIFRGIVKTFQNINPETKKEITNTTKTFFTRIAYGFGFGLGMGVSFKILNFDKRDNYKNEIKNQELKFKN